MTSGHAFLSCIQPYEHAHAIYDKEAVIINALMVSIPNHPLFPFVFEGMAKNKDNDHVLAAVSDLSFCERTCHVYT